MSTMKDLARIVADRHDIEVQDSELFVSNMFDVIIQALTTDEQVKVKGLGTFKIQTVRERASININTGEKVIINSHERITFTPDTAMRNSVNKPFAHFETVPLNEGVVFDDMIEEEEESEKGKEERTEKKAHSTDSGVYKTEEKGQRGEDNELRSDDREQGGERKEEKSDKQSPISILANGSPQSGERNENAVMQVYSAAGNIHTEATEDAMPGISQQISDDDNTNITNERSKKEDAITEQEAAEGIAASESEENAKDTHQSSVEDTSLTNEMQQEPAEDTTPANVNQPEPEEDGRQVSDTDNGETASIVKNVNAEEEESPVNAYSREGNTPQEEEYNDDNMANSQDFNNEPSRNSNNMSTATSILIGILLLIAGFVIGRATADITFEDIKNMVLQEKTPVETDIVHEEANTPIDTIDRAVNADTISVKEDIANQKAVDTEQAANPQPAEQTKENIQAETKGEPEVKKPANEDIPAGKYDADPRIRTGAYNIVGVREIVTVQKGQTLASISKAHLGPGMECYIEALNGKGEVKVGQNVKIPELKLKKARK